MDVKHFVCKPAISERPAYFKPQQAGRSSPDAPLPFPSTTTPIMGLTLKERAKIQIVGLGWDLPPEGLRGDAWIAEQAIS